MLAVAAHPLAIDHSFQARFYGPWLAAIVWFAYFLERSRDPAASPVWAGLAAGCAVLVCTLHYFGVLTLGLVVGSAWLFGRFAAPARRLGLSLTALGPLGILACIPFFLRQRAVFAVPTWISQPNADEIVKLLNASLLPNHLGLVVLIAWFAHLFRGFGRPAGPVPLSSPTGDPAGLAGLSALALWPLGLVLISYTIQPATVDRYALPAVAALAPAVAWAAARMGRLWQVALCACLVLTWAYQERLFAQAYQDETAANRRLIAALREHTGGAVVYFESGSCHHLFMVDRYAPDLAPRCAMIDFADGEMVPIEPAHLVGRNIVRNLNRYYCEPRMASLQEVLSRPRFFLAGEVTEPEKRYPGFAVNPVAEGLYELVKPPLE